MSAIPRAIQGLILFSTLLGVVFLWQVYPLLPSSAFDFVVFGWVLFAIDSGLTFVRPKASYFLGFLLAIIALAETIGQPSHQALLAGGNVLAIATIVLGSAAQALLIILVGYYFLSSRRKDPWSWPSSESQS